MAKKEGEWNYIYYDSIHEQGPLDWTNLIYYLDRYVGKGHIVVKVREGAVLIEKEDQND